MGKEHKMTKEERELVQFWRDDAFRAAAEIVDRYHSSMTCDVSRRLLFFCKSDILALVKGEA